MAHVLITGANGFVGYYLTKLLLDKGFRVTATGKGSCRLPYADKHFQYLELDFTNETDVEKVIGLVQPGVLVHLGALSKPDECELDQEAAFRVNVEGTRHLLKAAASRNAHFLFLSTDFVFDGKNGMYEEEDARAPVNYYGHTKMTAEDDVMQYEGLWSIVRTVLVYGKPFLSRHNIITNVAQGLHEGKTLKIFSDQSRTPTYVEDLVLGILAIIEKRAAGIYHLSGKDVLSPYEIAVAVAQHLHCNQDLIQSVTESEFSQPARRPPKTGFNLTKARSELSYEPVSFQEGLAKTLKLD